MVTKGLQAWVDKLSKVDMPVLANVVKELNELTGSDETEVNQLAEVILKDASLTSQVLRVANSVQYNPSSFSINTVSRAIVLIGFTGVRGICISVMVIGSLLGEEPRERLLEGLAQSFHAAVQARNLVRQSDESAQEEVFIAALLFHLGDMAFWACGDDAGDKLDALYRSGEFNRREAMEEVLGTSFKSITKALVGIWNLGSTLEQALYPPKSISPKVQAVCLGEELSRKAIAGWDSPEVMDVVEKMATFCEIEVEQARKMAMDMADEAAAVALTYGVANICHLIPGSKSGVADDQKAVASRERKADPQLQLNILRELSAALMENLDINTIFQMVLEGIHRGVGLERAGLALIQNNRVKAKYVLGEGVENWRAAMDFPVGPQHDNIFSYAIRENKPLWINQKHHTQIQHLYSKEIQSLLGVYPAFLSNIRIGSRDVALFYADSWKLGRGLDQEQFASFQHFVLQTQLALQILAQKK